MDVDIVPSLMCSKWPESSDYRPNPNNKKVVAFIFQLKQPQKHCF